MGACWTRVAVAGERSAAGASIKVHATVGRAFAGNKPLPPADVPCYRHRNGMPFPPATA